ncbi:MAG: hypothetical protein IJE78_00480 [Bacteroidaceae bacterium]|nr:hypothetical protein [Bacteroidaceae bacterium]MBQ2855589.1 hypothetical protein [Bacteroidaceae bacterium]
MIRRRFYQQDKKYDKGNYLTIEALVNNFTFTFTQELEYNVNGDGWKTLAANEELPSMRQGDFISLRANLRPTDSMGIGFFSINSAKKCKLSGNCMSLLFGDNAYTKSSLKGYGRAFYYLFDDCSGIVEVSSNFLPATTLGYECYRGMFNHCLSLVKAPDLPATTLESGCYSAMFDFCTSLAKAPDLPATTLVRTCYYDMFYGCVNLKYIKMLATDISAELCLSNWVYGVSPTGTFVKSKDATWDVVGDSGVPTGWTVINDGEENADGFGVQFPIHFEFDSCETIPNLNITSCYRKGDDLGINLYNYIVFIIAKYGEVYPAGIFVFEETLSLLGIEIYIEGSKVVSLDHSEVGYYLNTDGDYLYTIIRSDGSLLCEQ